jgi:starch phosphorylase
MTDRITRRKSSIVRISNTALGDCVRPDLGSAECVNNEKIWRIMSEYEKNDVESLQVSIVRHIECTLARTRFDFKEIHCYEAVAHSVRDRLI